MEASPAGEVQKVPGSRLGDRKIFCLGFNKTGTTTLHRIFSEQLGISSAHNPKWTYWSVARDTERLGWYQAFSDGGCASVSNLEELYPDALFVLNTRLLKHWVLSRHKAVARSRAATRWALTKYVPLGWVARIVNRWLLDNSSRAMRRWIAIRNGYHRHVMEHFEGREDELLVLDIEAEDAPRRLARFLGVGAELSAPVANRDGGGSNTRIILDAIGAKVRKDDSVAAVEALFQAPELDGRAGELTWFESDELGLGRSVSDRLLRVLPFLRPAVRRLYVMAVTFRYHRRSFFAKWVADRFVKLFRSEEDLDWFTPVDRLGSASR